MVEIEKGQVVIEEVIKGYAQKNVSADMGSIFPQATRTTGAEGYMCSVLLMMTL